MIRYKSQARARQVLAALEQWMAEVGLDLDPDKTRIAITGGRLLAPAREVGRRSHLIMWHARNGPRRS